MEISDIMPHASRAIAATSPSLDRSIGIVVCIPCFRRPQHLRRTLQSLADQRTDRRFAVVIVENDASACESVPVAAEFLQAGKFPGLCVVEPRQGNCHAINAAFETALATFPAAAHFLMIDDDEIASADWLELMVRRRGDHRRRCGRRPGISEFRRRQPSAGCAAILRSGRPMIASGPVPVIYGCGNCLITRSVFATLADPAFDLRFNFLGGGDTDFFMRCRRSRNEIPLGRRRRHYRDRAAQPDQSGMARAARAADRRDQLSRRAQGGADRAVARSGCWRGCWQTAVVVRSRRPADRHRTKGRSLRCIRWRLRSAARWPSIGIEPQPYKASKIAS